MPPSQYWYCILSMTILYMSALCSTLFILNMTFDRFYSIIRPHKAASFNTMHKAKITVISIVTFSILFNIPHLFVTFQTGKQCVPFGKALGYISGKFYYWLSFVLNFALPFVSLLIMNSFIIHTLRQRTQLIQKQDPISEGPSRKGHDVPITKIKNSELQIYVILILVTFAFLILTTPPYALFLFMMFVDYQKSAQSFVGFYLFYSVGQKAYYTDYGINFYLYVISGKKFRADLLRLFKYKPKSESSLANLLSVYTVTATT